MSLYNELKDRNVFRIGAAYVVGAWLLIQVAETIFPLFGFGDAPARLVVIVLAIGFIPSLIMAWVFEITPDGLKKEADGDYDPSTAQVAHRKLDRIILIVLALALAYFTFDKFVLDPVEDQQIAQSARQEGLSAALTESRGDLSIAVLPFDNRSNREEDEFFTDGIHDDLLTTIAKIGSIQVISRTSVMEYKHTIKKLPQIAQELGVANILEGGIQRSGNQVRINVQLINASTDEHLWAEIYDRELTAENLFAVQSEITKKIADALRAELSTDERNRIETVPTVNLQAYEAYLRGRQLMATRNPESLAMAVEEFSKATEIDPSFALAWVGVADSLFLSIGYIGENPEEVYPMVEDAVNRAMAIDNGLGEAYASLAWIHEYYGRNEEAEVAYKKAIELNPNYAIGYHWYSIFIGLGDPLRAQESVDLMHKAAILDPRSGIIGFNLAETYRFSGQYTLAENQYRKVIDLNPDFGNRYMGLINLYRQNMGQLDKALTLINKAISLNPENLSLKMSKGGILMNLGDLGGVSEVRDEIAGMGADEWVLGFAEAHISFMKGNKAATREIIVWLLPQIQNRGLPRLILGSLALAQGDIQLAREIYLALEPGWLDPGQWPALINMVGNTKPTACFVAWILISTGDEEVGTELLQTTMAYIEDDLPLLSEHPDLTFLDSCHLVAGDTEKAILSIETQLAHNHLNDWYIVHEMPMYDLIRDEPRYQAAWAEHQRRISVQRESIKNVSGASY